MAGLNNYPVYQSTDFDALPGNIYLVDTQAKDIVVSLPPAGNHVGLEIVAVKTAEANLVLFEGVSAEAASFELIRGTVAFRSLGDFWSATVSVGASEGKNLPGSRGATGASGAPGIGIPGDLGATGPQGNSIVGSTGPTGPDGKPGNPGLLGPSGPTGPKGSASEVPGFTGATGPEGPSGPVGAGATGFTGPTGARGYPGFTGPKGEPGAPSLTAGATGATGPAGNGEVYPRGIRWFKGYGPPASLDSYPDAIPGDLYLDLDEKDIYEL